MFGLSSPLIENYLREAGFWHVATIGRGCKLDPKLISALIERWRPVTHTFHLPCGECTITLEDVQLQLRLLVDGSALTKSVQSVDWGAEPGNNLTKVERIRYARAYIFEMIRGYLMLDLSRNLVHLSYIGIPAALEDIRLLLDQRPEAQFQWTPYEDMTIRAVIPDEFFQNQNIWHVNVPLVNYATVEMHQMDRVLQQFRFRQSIFEAPEVLDKEHKINLR
ncbi:hypothetical protein Gotur_013120 [Gossypium turneri]